MRNDGDDRNRRLPGGPRPDFTERIEVDEVRLDPRLGTDYGKSHLSHGSPYRPPEPPTSYGPVHDGAVVRHTYGYPPDLLRVRGRVSGRDGPILLPCPEPLSRNRDPRPSTGTGRTQDFRSGLSDLLGGIKGPSPEGLDGRSHCSIVTRDVWCPLTDRKLSTTGRPVSV